MNKLLTRIAKGLLGLSMAVGVGVALAAGNSKAQPARADETYSMTPNQSSTGSSATAYITSLTEFTYSGITWQMNQWNPKTLQVKTNQGSATSEFRFYNTTAFSGRIKSVTISFSSITIKTAGGFMFIGGTSAVTSTTGGTAGSWDSSNTVLTWTPGSSDDYTYFAFYQNGKVASGNNFLSESNAIVVSYESGSSTTKTATTTTITPTADQTIDLASSNPTVQLSASVIAGSTSVTSPAVTWSNGGSSVANVSSNGLVTGLAVGSATITASYAGNDTYKASSATKTITVIDSNAPGSEAHPYTVAQARAAIDANTGITGVYATGIISSVESYNSTYHSLTYWISADGTTTSDQLEVYSGKNLNNTNFNGLTDISSGATVKIYGNLKKFTKSGQTIYEFDMNNYLVSYEAPTQCTLTYNADGVKTGSVPAASTSYNSGTEITVPGNTGNLSIEGYTFVGWNDGTQTYSAGDKFNLNANTTLTLVMSRNSGTKGSETNPYSVAEARAAIDDGQGPKLKDACVSGLISQVDSYSSQYKSITYWISADGTTTDQLQVYSGKGLNGADFSAQTDVEVGATVVICGLLKLHDSTYEFDKNNVQVSYTAPSAPVTYTVTYDANGGTGTMTDSTEYAAGTSVTVLANAFSKEGYTFAGWKDQDGNTVSGSFTINMNTTLYAQWTENVTPQPGGDEWVLTSITDLTSNDIFVIVGDNGVTYAMSNDNGASSAPEAVAVTIANNKITSTVTDNLKWNIGGNATNGYTFYKNGVTDTWLYCTTSNNGVRVGNNANKTFTIDSGYLKHVANSRYVGIYNSQDWRCYTSINSNISGQTFGFYKYVAGSTPQPSETSIVSGAFTYNDKLSLFVEDIGVMVVKAPEGYTELSSAGDAGYSLFCGENFVYNSTAGTVSFDYMVLADEATEDVEIELYWYVDNTYQGEYKVVTETIQIINPNGLAGARTYASLINDQCHADTKDFDALESLFEGITEAEKAWLLNAHYDVEGTGNATVVTKDDDTHYVLAEAMSRYDFMVENLGMNNFLNKTGLVQNASRVNLNNMTSESSVVIVIVVSLVSISSLGILLVIKKRRVTQ